MKAQKPKAKRRAPKLPIITAKMTREAEAEALKEIEALREKRRRQKKAAK